MEYVSGGSLRNVIEQFGPPPLNAVRRYLGDILKGLVYLHTQKVVHCDLKPHNALLSNDGSVKLSDFGSSLNTQQVKADKDKKGGVDEDVTVRGTAHYMAPEAARNEITSASDIWSLGITVLELLTGNVPWQFKGSDAAFVYKLSRDETFMPTIPPNLHKSAADFCRACLQRDPAKRPTAQALQLTEFVTGSS